MLKPLPVVVAFTMVIASWVVPGLWSGPRHQPELLEQAAARVFAVPLEIGDWHGKAREVDRKEFEQAGAVAYWGRQYTRRSQSVTVLLMCGHAGKMAVHTPQFCYQGLGFEMVDSPQRVDIDFGPNHQAEFWTARYAKPVGMTSNLRLFWSWNAGQGWKASTSPFRRDPLLYKLYVVHDSNAQQQLKDEPAMEFLPAFLAELQHALFSGT